MAGWSVLEAELGLAWNALTGTFTVGATPKWGHSAGTPTKRPHLADTVPLLTGTGWGEVTVDDDDGVRVRCHHGRIPLRRVLTPAGEWNLDGNDLTPLDEWVTLTRPSSRLEVRGTSREGAGD